MVIIERAEIEVIFDRIDEVFSSKKIWHSAFRTISYLDENDVLRFRLEKERKNEIEILTSRGYSRVKHDGRINSLLKYYYYQVIYEGLAINSAITNLCEEIERYFRRNNFDTLYSRGNRGTA